MSIGHYSFVRPQPGVSNFGWLETVRMWNDPENVGPIEIYIYGAISLIGPYGDDNGVAGEVRKWDVTNNRWARVDEDDPDLFIKDRTGAPFLWVGSHSEGGNAWGPKGITAIQGDRGVFQVGYDGPDLGHIYCVGYGGSYRSGFNQPVFYVRYPDHPYAPNDDDTPGWWGAEIQFYPTVPEPLPPDYYPYQIPGFVTWSQGREKLYLTGCHGYSIATGPIGGQTFTNHDKPIIVRSNLLNESPFGNFDPYPGDSTIEWVGDEADPGVIYEGVSIRETQDQLHMLCCISGSVGTRPMLLYKETVGEDWREFETVPPAVGWSENRVNYLDAHGSTIDDVWVVGIGRNSLNTARVSLFLHWDGTTWVQYSVPDATGLWTENDTADPLYYSNWEDGPRSVFVYTPDNVWVVGNKDSLRISFDAHHYTYYNSHPYTTHWDGVKWTTYDVELI